MSIVSTNEYFEYFGRFSVAFITYPLEYVKCLIQLGYEPIPGRHSHTFFGQPCIRLAGFFDYVKVIKEKHGYIGLYNGITFKIASQISSGVVYNKLQELEFFQVQPHRNDTDEETEASADQETVGQFSKKLALEGIARSISIVVSHPLHVITIRKMAQFIGGDDTYNGIMSPFYVIYQDEGWKGFFKGLTARIIGDLVTLGLSSALSYIVNHYLIREKAQRSYSQACIIYGVSSVTYPFTLVSNIMSVNNTKMAQNSLDIPVYSSWVHCWSDLKLTNNLNRGSSVAFRKKKIDLSKSPFMPAINKQFFH